MPLSLDGPSTQVGARRTAGRIADLQVRLGIATQEVSTGTKADASGELGARTSVLLGLRAAHARAGQYQAGGALLSARLDGMHAALSGMREATGTLAARAEAALGRGDALSLDTVRRDAIDALETVQRLLNTSVAGRHLFAGSAIERAPLPGGPDAEGFLDATIQAHAAGGTVGSTEIGALIDDLDATFDDSHADPARRFSTVYYAGADPDEPPLAARIDEASEVAYGVKASDPALRDLLQGLRMLAGIGPGDARMSEEAHVTFVREGASRLQRGLDGLDGLVLATGRNQATVANGRERLEDARALYNNQIVELEGRDPYEASLRLTALEQQMEATFAVTARLADLSLLRYLR
ncbi:flagellin [Marinivivus vitaminiproducens]|uniref:flagellin n=1 Tax=Marinivivus vitaminiproducens TaxID=3035935 RepID=UPI00279E5228|nr:flagellin [Geminicoccaceae bacterium SCSIO 64248]